VPEVLVLRAAGALLAAFGLLVVLLAALAHLQDLQGFVQRAIGGPVGIFDLQLDEAFLEPLTQRWGWFGSGTRWSVGVVLDVRPPALHPRPVVGRIRLAEFDPASPHGMMVDGTDKGE